MRSNVRRLIYVSVSILFWIAVWQITHYCIDLDFAFPSITDTAVAFFENIITPEYWLIIVFSFLRIVLGFCLGVVFGIAIAFLTHASEMAYHIFSPVMSVIKSTPVASFILLLWVIIGNNAVPVAIAVLMVAPIIWQNLSDGFKSVDPMLSEVCDVFELRGYRRFKLLVAPALRRFFVPALFTASGLAWKSGIAAEIIAYTKNSIGKEISDAKNFFDGAQMFSWTVTVIVLSILIEKTISFIVRRSEVSESDNK